MRVCFPDGRRRIRFWKPPPSLGRLRVYCSQPQPIAGAGILLHQLGCPDGESRSSARSGRERVASTGGLGEDEVGLNELVVNPTPFPRVIKSRALALDGKGSSASG